MKCKVCGIEIANDAKFCKFCGEEVVQSLFTSKESVVETTYSPNSEEKYSLKETIDMIAGFITAVLCVIACIVLIGCWLGFFNNSNPVPLFIFLGVVGIATWLEEKLPKFPTIFFAVFEIVSLIICFSISNDVSAVLSVQEGSPTQYPNITYERAFENYFVNPTWEACGQDEDGNEIVKFMGTCTYLGNNAVAEVKFRIYEEQESFVVSSVKLNGKDMGLSGNAMIVDIFEEYQNSH